MKSLYVIMASLLVLALAAGCGSKPSGSSQPSGSTPAASQPSGSQPAAQPAGPSKITIAIKEDPTGFDAHRNEDGNMRYITDSVYDSLVERDGKTMEIKPWLAESWTQISPTVTQFKLRQGVKFHNGNPFTADDVVYSVNRAVSEELNSAIKSYFIAMARAEKVDDYTVNIITHGPTASLFNRLNWLKMFDKETFEGQPLDYPQTNVNGTGQYKVVKWDRGVQLELAAVPGHFAGKPPIDTIIIRPIKSDSTRLSALKAGEIDLGLEMFPDYLTQVPVAKTAPSLEYYLLHVTRFRGPFQNAKLVDAAWHAIDRKALAEKLFGGQAEVFSLPQVRPFSVGYPAKPTPERTYDPEKAKALMKEAGYNGEKIVLVGENGRWLKDGETVQAVGQMLSAVGFNVEIKMIAFSEWLDVLLNREKSGDLLFTSHSNEIFDIDRTYTNYTTSVSNSWKYHLDLLPKVEAARAEADPAKRQQLYEEIHEIFANDLPVIPLVNPNNLYGLSTRIDWEPRLDQRIMLNEIKLKG